MGPDHDPGNGPGINFFDELDLGPLRRHLTKVLAHRFYRCISIQYNCNRFAPPLCVEHVDYRNRLLIIALGNAGDVIRIGRPVRIDYLWDVF